MTKYELSLTPDYVPDWGLKEAIRELFQNALDQETTMPDNTMFWEYHDDIESLHIGNKLSILEPRTLLLGSSTKTTDDKTIGKFGEGYKIAALVLTRLGKKITFYNYGAREVWRVRFSKSRKYQSDILVFEVDKKFPWAAVPNNNLTIVVEGITEEELFGIGEHNLHMQEGYMYWTAPKGNVLLDADLKGKMFVNGLYICTDNDFHYGYNFKPEHIKLDRDRRLIPNFELKWTTSQIWSSFSDEDWSDEIIRAADKLLQADAPDVAFFESATSYYKSKKYLAIADGTYKSFKEKHGENAVPVTSTLQLESLPKQYKPVIVTGSYNDVLKSSSEYTPPVVMPRATPKQQLEKWLGYYGKQLSSRAKRELKEIMEDMQ